MDRKTVLLLVASFAALFLWQFLVGVWFPPVPKPPGATNLVASATNGLGTNAITSTPNVTPAPVTTLVATTNQPITLDTNITEKLEVLEAGDTVYTFTSRGG